MLRIEIAQPCDMTWTAMKGDEQVRHCGACRKNVYNVSTMTEAEVGELIRRTEGHFCARVYRRTDGRVLTADCPRGVRAARRRRVLKVSAALAAVTVLGAFGMPVYGTAKVRRHTNVEPLPEPIGYTTGIAARPIGRGEATLGAPSAIQTSEVGQIAIPDHDPKPAKASLPPAFTVTTGDVMIPSERER